MSLASYTMHFRSGHPAGYTDDLGILADENRWVREEYPGWYVYLDYYDRAKILSWCQDTLTSAWDLRGGLLWMSAKSDATLFTMTWG